MGGMVLSYSSRKHRPGLALETAKELLSGSAPCILLVTAINQVELEPMHAELVDVVNKRPGNGIGQQNGDYSLHSASA
jgi:hypothetical protein